MTGTEILALVAFVALALALLLVLRGMGQVIAATRADEAFMHSIAEIVGRASNVLRGALEQADAARYRGGPHADLDRAISTSSVQVASLMEELKAMPVPRDRGPDHDTIARDLGSAFAALGVLEGGSEVDIDDAAEPAEPGNAADAGATDRRVAVKRGYLALAHAERSLTEHAEALSHDRPRPDRRLFRR